MKALAILVACFALGATPSYAGIHAGGGHLGPHKIQILGRHGDHHDHNQGGGGSDFLDSTGSVISGLPAPDENAALPPPPGPFFGPPPPFCPPWTAAAAKPSGPHIIYIGERPPTPANAPKVIYGTD